MPKASSTGLPSMICSDTERREARDAEALRVPACVNTWSTCLVLSVLPAPLSPLISTHWLTRVASMLLYASTAVAKM